MARLTDTERAYRDGYDTGRESLGLTAEDCCNTDSTRAAFAEGLADGLKAAIVAEQYDDSHDDPDPFGFGGFADTGYRAEEIKESR